MYLAMHVYIFFIAIWCKKNLVCLKKKKLVSKLNGSKHVTV